MAVISVGSKTFTSQVVSERKAFTMGTENNSKIEERNTPEYLAQLLKDKKQIQAFPNVFLHAERLIDEGELVMASSSFCGVLRREFSGALRSNLPLVLGLHWYAHCVYCYLSLLS